jgi:hypothetical protein
VITRDTPPLVLALGDALAGAADDLGVTLRGVDARRMAPHVVELLAVAGWVLVQERIVEGGSMGHG